MTRKEIRDEYPPEDLMITYAEKAVKEKQVQLLGEVEIGNIAKRRYALLLRPNRVSQLRKEIES